MTNQPNDQQPPTQDVEPTPAPQFIKPEQVAADPRYAEMLAAQNYQPYRPQIAPKSPGLALVASFFIPGLGSLINGNAGIGILIFCLYLLSWALLFVVVGFITLPAVWIWGMVDAYSGAKKWNTAHGIIS